MAVRSSCPSEDDLQRFLLGRTDDPEADQLEQHLTRCPRCLGALDTLRGEDTLTRSVSSQATADALPHEEKVERLIDRLCGVGFFDGQEASTVGPGATGGASAESTRELYAFLAPAQAPDELGRLGPYRVLRVLGAGGMGVVFQAEDPQLQRLVALKVMRLPTAGAETSRLRFLREARAAAAIQHDHIVPIYHVGEDRGVPFLAMPFLQGEPLDACLRRVGRLSPAEVVRIGRETAEGLAAAHARGLIHRDIKPGNIWLESNSEFGMRNSGFATPEREAKNPPQAVRPSEFRIPNSEFRRVKILDFGLARTSEEAGQLTQEGAIVGTPAFMSPEQARGQTLDGRSDLFSLGAVLYRACTGRQPFQGGDTVATVMAVATEDPAPPCKLDPAVPRALSDLIMRLLAKEPEDRPASARAAAAAFAALESEIARPANRGSVRRPGWVVAAAVLAGVLAAAGWWFAPTVIRIATNRGVLVVETTDPDVVVSVKRDGEEVQVIDKQTGKEVTLHAGTYQLELAGGAAGLRLDSDRFTLSRGGKKIVSVYPDPAAARRPPAGTGGPAIPLPADAEGQIRCFAGHPDGVTAVAYSPDGRFVLSGGGGEYSEDGKTIAGRDFDLRLWDVETGNLVRRFVGHREEVLSVAFSPDGRRALSGSDDATARVWDVATGRQLVRFTRHREGVLSVAFSPDGRRALSTGRDNTVRLWDTETGEEAEQLVGHKKPCWRAVFSGDGKRALTGSDDRTIRLWEVDTGKQVKRLGRVQNNVSTVALSPDGRQALSGGGDDWVRLWDLAEGKEVRGFEGHTDWVRCVAFSPDGKRALSCSSDRSVRLWDVETGKEIHCFEGHTDEVWAVAFSPDGRRAVSCSSDRTIRLWALPK